jgi:histone H1/5
MPAKKRTSASKKKAPPSHPPFIQLVRQAIGQAKAGAQGASRAAIKNWIVAAYPTLDDGARMNAHIRKAIDKGLNEGYFVQGSTSQRFKLGPNKDLDKKTKGRKAVAAAPTTRRKRHEIAVTGAWT